MGDVYAVELIDIKKSFGGVKALKGASLKVARGEVHALVGENGAGKSTLIKVLSGVIKQNSGNIKIFGEEVPFMTPKSCVEKGIAVVYQEFILANALSVAENIFIDDLKKGGKLINWKKLYSDTRELLDSLGFGQISPKEMVGNLSVAHQQVVEICKALSRGAKVLVLDEPTAVLTFTEIQRLFGLIRELKEKGVSTIFISHRLEEIYELCDTVSVMKDGESVGTYPIGEISKRELIQKMVGRELSDMYPKREGITLGEVALKATNVSAGNKVKNVSFEVRKGEVVGFAGLVGAGRTEVMRAIFGADKLDSGEVVFMGNPVHFRNPQMAVRSGLGMVPEDRKRQGVILRQSIRVNTTLAAMKLGMTKQHLFNDKKEKQKVKEILAGVATKYNSTEDNVDTLSGGNQQKISLAKWLGANCKVIILDEPTRGVDVGAKFEIYSIINLMASQGIAIVVVSSEMDELLGTCDRIIAMRNGEVTGELSSNDMTEQNIIKLIMGVK